ncbi:MAG TPA: adenylate/guanylate cyclase domain-containing protein [Candidatus Limnocylindrales bacterium]
MPAAPHDVAVTAAPGDRRVVTALFADLVNYVRMLAENDAEDVKRRVDAALAAMDTAVVRFGGTREKFIGDAIFAVFGHPAAHDDDALRAALCALAIRASLASLEVDGEEPLAVRIGIATGEVVAAPRGIAGSADVALTGPAVAIAARIQGLAGPGEILVDDATLRASRGRLVADDRGTRRVRGHPGPIRVHALRNGAAEPFAPGSRRLVGRLDARARLRSMLDVCRATGLGRVAVIVGDAGIGKSRLLADLEDDARAAAFRWTWVENASYATGEPYRFVRQFAQAVADDEGGDSGATARRLMFSEDLDPTAMRRIAGAIAAIAREAEFSGWEAEAPLAPTDPAEVALTIVEAARRYCVRLAELLGPRVIVIDDFHWTDRSSLPTLEELVALTPGLPFVVVFATRPTTLPAWLGTDDVMRLDLRGLTATETAELAAGVAGTALATAESRDLHARTRGNPLFVGETVRALLDDGSLALRDGRMKLVRPDRPASLPVTLRALLGARIDALSPAPRDVIRVASVIGSTFSAELVTELLGRSPGTTTFDALVDAALVVRLRARGSWGFAHPLIREAAYAGLLTSRRRALHGRLADLLDGQPGIGIGRVARHRTAAGDVDAALPLLEQAARDALALGATAEAAEFWRTAAGLVPVGDPRATAWRKAADAAVGAVTRRAGRARPPAKSGARRSGESR